MEEVKTKDNSITYFNEKYQERYHSVSGALEEAFEKFAKPCKLKDGMNVLDICFGLGYNSLAAISLAKVKIIALENDLEILETIETIPIKKELQENYNKIKQAAKNHNYSDKDIEIKIILGNALETIKKLKEKFDVVFLDPFSPKKCPELWTESFFSDIRKVMKPNSVLATYSCARIVRDNLEKVGFKVKDGPCVGRKSPSTLAYSA